MILLVFFLLCVSVLLVTAGQLGPLAGVYTISFLSVMAFFAYGNFLLKSKQPHLPRPVRASIFTVGLALAGVLAALFGNIKLHPEDLVVFLEYFLPAMFLVYAMLNRTDVLELLRLAVESLTKPLPRAARVFRLLLWRQQRELARQEYIFFTKDDDLINLNKVMAYVVENEFTSRLRIVTLLHYDEDYPAELLSDIRVLDHAYAQLSVDVVVMTAQLGPDLVDALSRQWGIPKNFMFIGSTGDWAPYHISELGGVRLII